MYKKLKYELTGIGKGLMMGNSRMANPFDEFAQAAVRIKKKSSLKTEADIEEGLRLGFMASLYLKNNVPGIPENILIATIASGCGFVTGKENTKYRLNLRCLKEKNFFPLIYDGPKKPEELWEKKEKFAYTRLMQGKLQTNVIFSEWKTIVEVEYNNEALDEKLVDKVIKKAGDEGYLMAWRRGGWGRFKVKKL